MSTVMQRELFYDLTEVMLKASSGETYYGILRVVVEIAFDFIKTGQPVRFCIFNFADNQFYEVFPELDESKPSGVALNVPVCPQIRIRKLYAKRSIAQDALNAVARPIAHRINAKRWSQSSGAGLAPVNLDGAQLMSAARPKLITEMFQAIEQAEWDVKTSIMLHDMIPLYSREGTERLNHFASTFYVDNCFILERADQIISNSQFTHDDIADLAAEGILPPPKSSYIVPLVHQCDEGTEPAIVTLPSEPYVMTVGAQLGRKNLNTVFAAIKHQLDANRPVPKLVLAGQERKRTTKFLEKPENAALREHIIPIVSPNQTDLVRLYKSAQAVILASHIEGWGLPPAEALWNGTPVLASDIPVMHEVCGDLAWYFPVMDHACLAGYLERLETQPEIIQNWRDRIQAAKPDLRTWPDVAREIFDVSQKPQP